MASPYKGRRVLVTGGLGFIGSNLAIALAGAGAEVTALDVLWPEHGGNFFNVEPVRKEINVNVSDVRDACATAALVKGADYIFHLAGQCSHVLGQVDPYPDIDINIRGTAVLLEAVKNHAPKAVVLYTSTRGVYGSASRLPVSEDAPTDPKGLYELSNLAAEKLMKFYGEVHGIRTVNLRLSNVYGERAQMMHSKFGVVNWFIRQAMDNGTIKLFDGGRILRDFLYVGDCVEAVMKAAATPGAYGQVFNVGAADHHTIRALVERIIEAAGSGRFEAAPFTRERAVQEPGDFYPDLTRINSVVKWSPSTSLEDGLGRTVEYYRRHGDRYWKAGARE